MSIKTTTYIEKRHFNKWYDCFKLSNGRLLSNPIDGARVYVSYIFDSIEDKNRFESAFHLISTPIRESKKHYSIAHKIKVTIKRLIN